MLLIYSQPPSFRVWVIATIVALTFTAGLHYGYKVYLSQFSHTWCENKLIEELGNRCPYCYQNCPHEKCRFANDTLAMMTIAINLCCHQGCMSEELDQFCCTESWCDC
ncbi:hypothetical protein L596_000394 [Steinernema carpocapsae]|uniref:Uncharacterized protein n=1 Tax=Steinernema carpocapsae TaxID=34508 RepID=A0A4U8UI88_STECR|nr:hypothetical protein L596_000394 [Steinernema carpocapsae]